MIHNSWLSIANHDSQSLGGERRFDKAVPTLWNSLPLSLRNVNSMDVFKRELKTHFFRIAFKNFL